MRNPVFPVLCGAALFVACGGDSSTDPSDYSGTWRGRAVQLASPFITYPLGLTFSVNGSTVSSLQVETEHCFGSLSLCCILSFTSSTTAAISADEFRLNPEFTATPSGVLSSTWPPVTAVSFSQAASVKGNFSGITATGELTYDLTSAACGGQTYTGVGVGFGFYRKEWRATKQ